MESTPVCEPLTVDVPALDDSMHQADELPIVDPTGRGLKSFHERLARLVRGRAKDHVRIGIYGDSNMTLDFIAGPMRRDLQLRYGDAGHGFIALARPWSHYRHMDVVQEVDVAFTSYAITTKPTGDGAYGYAGIASESPSIGARVRVATAPEGSPVGTRASRFDVFYLTGPRRGDFDVEVDGTSVASLSSEAEGRGVGIHRVEVEDGAHTFDSVIKSAKYVRFLGGVLERSKPGVVVDQLGVGAMSTRCIPMEDPAVSAPMLAFRRYDLVVLMTGTSDIYDLDKAPGYVREVVALHRSVNEDVSFLLVAPPDRGVSHAMNKLVTLGAQRKALASEIGVAFWDLLGAMGGPTSMMTFIRKGMALPDQIHFTEKGGAWVSKRLTRALLASFDAYVRNHPRAGCDEAGVEELEPWPKGSHVTPAGQLQPAGQEEPVRTVRYR
ncbi:MAG: hypothetical protein HOW73_08510 [Polyangiaceae bacterium]|nr:hypothetical protein [Polyangiaceae bacterium]